MAQIILIHPFTPFSAAFHTPYARLSPDVDRRLGIRFRLPYLSVMRRYRHSERDQKHYVKGGTVRMNTSANTSGTLWLMNANTLIASPMSISRQKTKGRNNETLYTMP